MKKYNFTNKFNSLKKNMGINENKKREFNKNKKFSNNFNIIKNELKKGKEVLEDELFIVDDVFLLNGIPVLIYIKDHSNSKIDSAKHRKKVHLINCTTIKEMKIKNRFNRYVSTTRTDELYLISTGKKEKEVKLNICRNCISELDKNKSIQIKSVKEFFDSSLIAKDFYERDITYDENTKTYYPPNWKKISQQLRKEAKWRCQKCFKNMENDKKNLHVHHKDGVKQNTSPKNLEVLCYDCHSEEPFHSHMKK